MSEDEKSQVISELMSLSKALLEDAETARIIHAAGTKRNFSKNEEEIIRSFAENFGCPLAFATGIDERTGDHIRFEDSYSVALNLAVATGAARRIAEGEFSNFADKRIIDLFDKNVTYTGKPASESSMHRKLKWSDFYVVFSEYINRSDTRKLINEWARVSEEDGDYLPIYYRAFESARAIAWRYGLTFETNFVYFAYVVFNAEIDLKSEMEIKDVLLADNRFTKIVIGVG